MIFSRALLSTLLFIGASAALGWFVGYTLEFAFLAAMAVLLVACYHMELLREWLNGTDRVPPDLPGPWGNMAERIYQRHLKTESRVQQSRTEIDYLLESLDSLGDGVVILEGMEMVRWSNRSAAHLLGVEYPRDEGAEITRLVGSQDFARYLHGEDYGEPLLFSAGKPGDMWLQVAVSRFGEEDRLLYLRDVTRRARMEQVRRDFVGNVSHELRTPLTVISGYLGTFLTTRETLPPSLIKPLEQMLQQANRMENLLADLLWLSRIESEELDDKRELIDVAAMLEELRDELANTHPHRRVLLRLTAQVKVNGDYRQLYSAVSNLVQNAMKYSAEETPVTISWRLGIGGHHLSVSDQGIGIDRSHIPRLTERFYRVDDSRSSVTGGTGLGLAIVKHVAAAHEAHLRVESEVGRGSNFTLVFPNVRQASTAAQA
jgi:two-component system phosphate regulon sensor histidine kinase PhoR